MKADDERELNEREAYENGDETESVPPLVPEPDESESTLSTLFEVEPEPTYGRD